MNRKLVRLGWQRSARRAWRPFRQRPVADSAPFDHQLGADLVVNYRPKYVSFDCYGTLINYQIAPVTKHIVGDRISDEDWPAFVRSFSKYRYDQVLGSYYPYRDVLQDAFDRVCRKWGIESDPTAGKQF